MKVRKTLYLNENYINKLEDIKDENNISTLTRAISFLIDYYLRTKNEESTEEKEDEKIQQGIEELSQKLDYMDLNLFVLLTMLSDISEYESVNDHAFKQLGTHSNEHFANAVVRAKRYLAGKRYF